MRKKTILFIVIIISLSSCSNSKTQSNNSEKDNVEAYYAEEALLRFYNLPNPQAIEENEGVIKTISIDVFTKKKYEFFLKTDDEGEIDISNCILKITRDCDVDKELAECTKLNLIRREKDKESFSHPVFSVNNKKGENIKKHIYYNYAIDNIILSGKRQDYGPIFMNDTLSFAVEYDKTDKKNNYRISFKSQCDIDYIHLTFTDKKHEYSTKWVYTGYIAFKNESKRNCTVLVKSSLDIYCEGSIEEVPLYTLFKDSQIEILYEDIFGNNHRNLYPLKIMMDSSKEDLEVSQVDMPLNQKVFDLSNELLTDSDVENLPKSELRLMRNEIFARHGLVFKSKDLKEHFSKQSWYTPLYNNVTDKLTEIEKHNIELIKKYENHLK